MVEVILKGPYIIPIPISLLLCPMTIYPLEPPEKLYLNLGTAPIQ